ncbi:UNVERIFIED_CONTAM: hypothetical protein FKN15_069206 [Acipenser sinensis]
MSLQFGKKVGRVMSKCEDVNDDSAVQDKSPYRASIRSQAAVWPGLTPGTAATVKGEGPGPVPNFHGFNKSDPRKGVCFKKTGVVFYRYDTDKNSSLDRCFRTVPQRYRKVRSLLEEETCGEISNGKVLSVSKDLPELVEKVWLLVVDDSWVVGVKLTESACLTENSRPTSTASLDAKAQLQHCIEEFALDQELSSLGMSSEVDGGVCKQVIKNLSAVQLDVDRMAWGLCKSYSLFMDP